MSVPKEVIQDTIDRAMWWVSRSLAFGDSKPTSRTRNATLLICFLTDLLDNTVPHEASCGWPESHFPCWCELPR